MNRIIEYCQYIEAYGLYDHKSISHYYEIQYIENKVIINLFNIYEKKTKKQEQITLHNINLKEFCNFIIYIYEIKLHIGEYSDIEIENIAKKIEIKNIK